MAEKNFADALNQVVNGSGGLKPQIDAKADKNSPNFTGTPTATTADNDTDSTQLATTEFVQNLIRRLVGAAPETLDTLAELATAINTDPNFAETIVQALDGKLNKTDASTTYLSKTGTAASASKVIGGTVSLTGAVTGSGSFNSAGNVSITTSGGGTTYSTGTSSTAGITKLYTGTGSSTDGTMTQNAITTALNNKASSSDLSSLQTTVNNKLDKSDMLTLPHSYGGKNYTLTFGMYQHSCYFEALPSDTSSVFYGFFGVEPTYAELKFRPASGMTTYQFKSDGIYLNGTKITN